MKFMDRSDVVVVGAGILGCAAALHLIRTQRTVTLVDAGQVGAGTTQAGAGFVGLWSAGSGLSHPSWAELELELQHYGIDFYSSLASAGYQLGWRANGSMWLAVTQAGWQESIRLMPDQQLAPPDARLLEPDQIEAMTGGAVSSENVVGACLYPRGIQVSAQRAAVTMSEAFERQGGRINTGVAVRQVMASGDRVQGVSTDDGLLLADAVVLAAGSATNHLLAPIGWQLPMQRVLASRVIARVPGVTEASLPDTMPTIMVPELGGLWVRSHSEGLTLGNAWGRAALPNGATSPSKESKRAHQLVATMLDGLGRPLRHLMPGFSPRHVIRWTYGTPCYTPDGRFLVGPIPTTEGLFVLAGCNEGGVTHAPGLGRLIANLVDGQGPEYAKHEAYLPTRFPATGDYTQLTTDEALPLTAEQSE